MERAASAGSTREVAQTAPVVSALAKALKRRLPDIVADALLLVTSVFAVGPVVWGFLTSFKPASTALTYPPVFWASNSTLQNYSEIIFGTSFPLFFRNSAIVALGAIALTLVVAVPMAYAAVRFKFRLKTAVLFIVLSTAMIPGIAILVPLYLLAVQVNLHNTLLVLVLVYGAWQAPQVVWLMRAFLETLPPDLEEAAMVDGCTRHGALVRVVLPLCKPGLLAASLLVFIFAWNDWLIAATLTSATEVRVAQVGLQLITTSPQGFFWGAFMAYVMMLELPVLVAFALLQGRFIAAMGGGAIKG